MFWFFRCSFRFQTRQSSGVQFELNCELEHMYVVTSSFSASTTVDQQVTQNSYVEADSFYFAVSLQDCHAPAPHFLDDCDWLNAHVTWSSNN